MNQKPSLYVLFLHKKPAMFPALHSYLDEKEPVSIVTLFDDGADVCAVDGAAPVVQQQNPSVGGGHREETEQDVDGSPNGQDYEPEIFQITVTMFKLQSRR